MTGYRLAWVVTAAVAAVFMLIYAFEGGNGETFVGNHGVLILIPMFVPVALLALPAVLPQRSVEIWVVVVLFAGAVLTILWIGLFVALFACAAFVITALHGVAGRTPAAR